jgi:hypothetical protein
MFSERERRRRVTPYQLPAPVKNTSNVVGNHHGRVAWKILEKVLNKSNTVLLLLSQCVDVGKKQGPVMTAGHSHNSPVVELIQVCLDFGAAAGLMSLFAGVDCFVKSFVGTLLLWFTSCTCLLDVSTPAINLFFGKEVSRAVEFRAITCSSSMTMVEIPIDADVNIGSTIKKDE